LVPTNGGAWGEKSISLFSRVCLRLRPTVSYLSTAAKVCGTCPPPHNIYLWLT
jgi:hypothetical protein